MAVEHGLPLAMVYQVLGVPLDHLRPAYPCRSQQAPQTSDTDRRPGAGAAAPPRAGRLAVRRGGLPQGSGPLRREHGIQVSGKRVLHLLRAHGLLAPQRVRGRRKPRPHDATITPEGAHVANVGDRFGALQPVYDAVIDRFGGLGADVARGISLRHDWGPQYRSGHFLGSIGWLGIADDAAFLGELETNGCAERWIRTLMEQCLWAELHDTVDQLRQAVTTFVQTYNSQWLIGRSATAPQRRPTRTPP
jgi:transposase InsO family protein